MHNTKEVHTTGTTVPEVIFNIENIDWTSLNITDVTQIRVHYTDKRGDYPLHHAAGSCKDHTVVQALIDAGAKVNARGVNRDTPLHRAAKRNKNSNVIKVLLDAGADVHMRDEHGATPLHHAAEHNENSTIVQTILDGKKANVNACDYNGETPLHYVMAEKNLSALESKIKILIKAGADRNAKDETGKTPLNLVRYTENENNIDKINEWLNRTYE